MRCLLPTAGNGLISLAEPSFVSPAVAVSKVRQKAMNGGVSRWCYFVSGFFLLDTTGGLGVLSRLVYGTWTGSDPVTQSLNVLMFAASLTLFSCRRGKSGFVWGSVLALSAVGFPCLSALWSMDPETTVREGVIYLFVIIGAIGIAGTMDADEYMHLLSRCCFLAAIASILLLVASPSNAVSMVQDDYMVLHGEFVGIFAQKNVLGQVMAIGALATLHGIRVARYRVFGNLCMLLVFLGMTYASKSTGALMAALLFCGISAFDSLWRMGGAARMTGVIFAIFLTPLIIVAVIAPDRFLVLIGKDPTLTGRSFIWAYVIKDIWVKPWLGWGYFGFWQLSNPYALEINKFMQWVVPHAHNGLLESLLNVGIVGTALFAFILIRTIVLAVRCLGTSERALGISTISCCVGILVLGVSETVLMQPNQPTTPALFITGLMCERALYVAKRLRRYRVADSRGQIGRRLSGSRPLGAHA